jgi:hypothetical protein
LNKDNCPLKKFFSKQSFEASFYIPTIGLALYMLHWWSMIEQNQKELSIIPQNGILCKGQCEAEYCTSPRSAGGIMINGQVSEPPHKMLDAFGFHSINKVTPMFFPHGLGSLPPFLGASQIDSRL